MRNVVPNRPAVTRTIFPVLVATVLAPDDVQKCTDGGTLLRYDASGGSMLSTIALVLVVLWLLGYVTAYTMGGFIHILLVLAIVVVLVRLIQGRRVFS
jgi:FtsH-binding integral membrane protein